MAKRRRVATGIVAMSVMLGACAGSAAPATTAKASAFPDARVKVGLPGACPLSDTKFSPGTGTEAVATALLAILAPALIEKGLGLVSNALRHASGDGNPTTTFSGTAAEQFYEIKADSEVLGGNVLVMKLIRRPEFRCLSIVVGDFSSSPTLAADYMSESDAATVAKNFPGLTGKPRLYAEFELEKWTGLQAFKLIPRFLAYDAPPGDLALTLSFTSTASDTAFATTTFTFHELRPGMRLGGNLAPSDPLVTKGSGALSFPPVDTKTETFLTDWNSRPEERRKDAREMNTATAALGLRVPVSVDADVTFTRNVNVYLKAAADILSEKKGDLTTALTNVVVPARASAARIEEENAEASQQDAAALAIQQALWAQKDFERKCGATPPEATREELRIAALDLYTKQRKANEEWRKLGNSGAKFPGVAIRDSDVECKDHFKSGA